MNITITGFEGMYTGAQLKAYVGMTFMGNVIVKVNEKSVLVAKADKDGNPIADTEQKQDSLSLPYWVLTPKQSNLTVDANGRPYSPSAIEQAMQTLCHAGADKASTAIAAVAEMFTRSGALANEPIARFDGLSAGTLLTVIDQMANR